MIVEILEQIKSSSGSNLKKSILLENDSNDLLKKIFVYSFDPFIVFNVVKVPRVKESDKTIAMSEADRWGSFFTAVDRCISREVTGNAAIETIRSAFCVVTKEEEVWMRKILKKHLAIGASVKTINSVYPGLISTFEVSLAQKFDMKRLKDQDSVAIEPKLDGIRCFCIVEMV